MSNSCNPVDCSPSGSSVPGDLAGKNIEVGCHFLLQGSFWPRDATPSYVTPALAGGLPEKLCLGHRLPRISRLGGSSLQAVPSTPHLFTLSTQASGHFIGFRGEKPRLWGSQTAPSPCTEARNDLWPLPGAQTGLSCIPTFLHSWGRFCKHTRIPGGRWAVLTVGGKL